MARQLLKYFESFEYLKALLSVISNMVAATNLTDALKAKIRHHTQSAITEFIYIGFSAKEISDLIDNVFAEIDRDHNGVYYTSFPHSIPFDHSPDVTIDQKQAYNTALEAYISSLDVSKRVETLYKYIDTTSQTYIFQFTIHGLTTSNTIFKIGDVAFVHQNSNEFLEGFSESEESELDPRGNRSVYAQVEVSGNNTTALAETARRKLISTLDIMRFYETSRQTYQVGLEYKYFLDGEFYGSNHFEGRQPHLLFLEGMEIDYHARDSFNILYNSDLINNITLEKDEYDSDQIYSSLNYYLRATEAANYTQQILFSWIALESLMTYNKHVLYSSSLQKKETRKEDMILQYIPYIAIYEKFTANVFALYIRLYNLYHSYSGLGGANHYRGLQLTDVEAAEAGLNIEGPREINLAETIQYLKSIRNSSAKDLVKDLISEAIDVYETSGKADEAIQQSLRRSNDGVHTIYRYRNQIAHNGKGDTKVHQYVARLAKSYTRQTLRLVIEYKMKHPTATIEEGIARTKLKIEVDHTRLKRNELVDADQIKAWGVSS